MKASIRISKNDVIDRIDDRMYSSFIEHMGRAIYTGIYEPGHPTADEQGFRQDVMEAVKPLKLSHVRYPGGNFLSGYNWKDGIGPKEDRPVRPDLAWFEIEPNQVGTDEFLQWCEKVGVEPMLGVNLGTGTPQSAMELVEYVNSDLPTYYADLRRKNGHEKPYDVKLWCLGNEMDGPWQICGKTAEEYGRIAYETAKMMKWMDPSIELVACGSSGDGMPTFKTWERTVLEHCYQYVDYLSLHKYFSNADEDTPSFLAQSLDMEDMIKEVAAICEEAKIKQKGDHDVKLSFDEWNVWFHFGKSGKQIPKWTVGRAIDEEDYDDTDVLTVGCILNTLLRNADSVKISCLAQLINVIAPITTVPGGGIILRTIYYPYLYTSLYGRGTSLKAQVNVPTYDCAKRKAVPYLDCSAVLCDDGSVSLFAVNRSETESVELTLDAAEFAGRKVELSTLRGTELVTVPVDGSISLAPASWNMIRILA